ncbi:MAG: response regulator [Archangium sp.]|nr:response regulator [Archangium sp.]MDP3154924.1 response regulator [Archangium sp.]MDP3576043.1 response regulator [Archangium sp.]
MRILVIDAEGEEARSLATLLEEAGAETCCLSDGWELVSLLDSQHFDVVIGDDLSMIIAKELAPTSLRCMSTSARWEWTEAQIEALEVEHVFDKPWDAGRLLRKLKLITDG